MNASPYNEDFWEPRVGDYVQICGTHDEWEDVIGVLEEHTKETEDEVELWTLFVPTSSTDIRARHMIGVNDLTDYVRYELRRNENRVRIEPKNLERVDPADF